MVNREARSLAQHPRMADVDEGEARGLRLMEEYLAAERVLESRGIRHAIVVFGSTLPTLGDSRYYDIAREFGRIAGRAALAAGTGCVLTGGGPGIMEAANRGASEVGATSVGLNIALPKEQVANGYITPGLGLSFRYFALRKLHFLLRARALVAFPGGYGTLDELFETLTLVQTRRIRALPIVLVGSAYWKRAFDADFLVEQGAIEASHRALFRYADTAEEAWRIVEAWYRQAGEAVFPP